MPRLLVVFCAVMIGCSPSGSSVTVEENVQRKIDAMTKIAEAAVGPNAEFAVLAAVEDFRNIPFQAKTQPEATKKILEIYNTRVKGKLKGDAAAQVAGEIKLLEKEMN